MRFLTSSFFHDSKPFGFDFAEIFKFLKSYTVCIPPWSQTLRCASLRGVHHTAESSSAVCIPPGVKLRSVHHTAESSDEELSKSSVSSVFVAKSRTFPSPTCQLLISCSLGLSQQKRSTLRARSRSSLKGIDPLF